MEEARAKLLEQMGPFMQSAAKYADIIQNDIRLSYLPLRFGKKQRIPHADVFWLSPSARPEERSARRPLSLLKTRTL